MKQLSKRLMAAFWLGTILELLIVCLFETNFMLEGGLATNTTAEFIIATVMVLVTICAIPVALRMMKYGAVLNLIQREREEGLYKAAMLRMTLLMLPMLLNTVFYYNFLNVEFAYLAIVLAISLAFIVPTVKRCEAEMEVM